jgi:hypothetical protein
LIRTWLAAAMVASCCGLLPAAAVGAEDILESLAPALVGGELDRVLEGAELACRPDRADPDTRRCIPLPGALQTLGGVGVNAVETLFIDRHLALVTVYFPESRFADVLPVLTARLGEGRDWSVTLRSGMAGQFPAQIRIWERDRFVLVAQQYDRKIDRSSVIYGTPAAMGPLLERIKSTPPGGLGDL